MGSFSVCISDCFPVIIIHVDTSTIWSHMYLSEPMVSIQIAYRRTEPALELRGCGDLVQSLFLWQARRGISCVCGTLDHRNDELIECNRQCRIGQIWSSLDRVRQSCRLEMHCLSKLIRIPRQWSKLDGDDDLTWGRLSSVSSSLNHFHLPLF